MSDREIREGMRSDMLNVQLPQMSISELRGHHMVSPEASGNPRVRRAIDHTNLVGGRVFATGFANLESARSLEPAASAGRSPMTQEIDERKRIFARLLIRYVPLAAHIRRVLDERESHTAPRTRFLDELEDHMAEESAEETLRSVIAWARFAELFSYDDDSQTFSLENPA